MLYSGVTALVLLTGMGATMANFNWREAQQAELDAAMRAAVSTTAQLLPRVTESGVEETIKERTAAVLAGLSEGLQVSKDDITVAYDAATNVTRITVGGNAVFRFRGVWGSDADNEQDIALARQSVAVRVDIDRYETVIAADISESMGTRMEVGQTATKLDALKAAVEVAIGIMEEASAENTGAVTIGMVPFGSAVNVGDTSGAGETAGKRRYAHLLAGGAHDDQNAANTAHWVDAYHHYGSTGGSWGNDLQTQTLPIFQATKSWNLRGSTSIDLSDEAPGFGTWNVQREDFWNGCVMARWGAFWERPAACTAGCQRTACADGDTTCTQCDAGCWMPDIDDNRELWPATLDVAAWTPASDSLKNEPLHLSDAPPNASNANTRFTAYSWPDDAVSGTSDARLMGVLVETLDPGKLSAMHFVQHARGGDNNWSRSDSSGDWFCPASPIVPLTETAATLRTAATGLQAITESSAHGASGGTYLQLGVVWGLRVLSPLWSDIWEAVDAAGTARPLTPCATGETGAHCQRSLEKLIVLITDGSSGIGKTSQTWPGRVVYDAYPGNYGFTNPSNLPVDATTKLCSTEFRPKSTPFREAAADGTDTAFDARFSDLNAAGRFAGDSLNRLVANVERVLETTLTPQGRAELGDLTPWELFRGRGFKNDGTSLTDILVDANNGFGLDGRPILDDMACRNTSSFGAYGRIEDLMQIGGEPVAGVAPFANIQGNLAPGARTRLEDWLEDACRIAGERGVQIKAVYLSTQNASAAQQAIESADLAALGRCIDAANGSRSRDIYEAPTASQLASTFRSIFTVRRNLRFLN